MNNLLRRVLPVRKSERKEFLLLLLVGFFFAPAQSIYEVVSTALFLRTFDVIFFPPALVCSGLLGISLSMLFTHFQNRISFSKLSLLVYFFAISSNILFFLFIGFFQGENWFFFLAFILLTPTQTLLLLVFRETFDRLFNVRQSRRLQSGIQSAVIIASILAFYTIPHIHGILFESFKYLLLLSTGGFLLALVVLFFVFKIYYTKINTPHNLLHIEANNNFKVLYKHPYTSKLAFYALAVGVIFTIVEFSFLQVMDTKLAVLNEMDAPGYAKQNRVADFLAVFNGSVLLVALLLKYFVSDRLIKKYGTKISLLVMPILMLFSTLVALYLGFIHGFTIDSSVTYVQFFAAICLHKFFLISTRTSLAAPSFKVYLLAISADLRADMQARIEGIVREFAKFAAALVLFIFMFLPFFKAMHANYLLPWAAILLIYAINLLHKAYKKALQNILKNEKKFGKKDGKEKFLSENIAENLFFKKQFFFKQVALLGILDFPLYRTVILKTLKDDDSQKQAFALQKTASFLLIEAIPILKNIIDRKYFSILKNKEQIKSVYQKLKNAKKHLHESKYLEQLTYSKITEERKYGTLLLTYANPTTKIELLTRLLDDADQSIQISALNAAINLENQYIFEKLAEKLKNRQYGNTVAAAMAKNGDAILDTITHTFEQNKQDENLCLQIISIIKHCNTKKARDLLWEILLYSNENSKEKLYFAALKFLSLRNQKAQEAKFIYLEKEIEAEADRTIWYMSAYLKSKQQAEFEQLCEAIDAQVYYQIEKLFCLLILRYEKKAVESAKDGIQSQEANKIEHAIELLNIFLPRKTKSFLFPIFSVDFSYPERIRKIRPKKKVPELKNTTEILDNILKNKNTGANRWTKICAHYLIDCFPEIVPDYLKTPATQTKNTKNILSEEIAGNTLLTDCLKYSEQFTGAEDEKTLNLSQTAQKKAAENNMTVVELVRFLQKTPTFSPLPPYILCEIAALCQEKNWSKNQQTKNDLPADKMPYFIVLEGKLRVGTDTFLAKDFAHPHNQIQAQTPLKAVAETKCRLLLIEKNAFDKLLFIYEEIGYAIL